MEIVLKEVAREKKYILANLLEKYEYEFSQWSGVDVDNNGLYGYEYLDTYWEESNRHAFFILIDGHIGGFVMINAFPEYPSSPVDYVVSEFFVMHKYRKKGVGKKVALEIFSKYKGEWQLKMHPENITSIHFWRHVISIASIKEIREINDYQESIYEDGTPGIIVIFTT